MKLIGNRTRYLNKKVYYKGPIAYWMSRDQRVDDNWALIYASKQAGNNNQQLLVLFTLDWQYPGANRRHFDFMLKGLQEVDNKLRDLNIPFILRVGNPADVIETMVNDFQIGLLVTDFDPLRIKQHWKSTLIRNLQIPIHEVDTHNVVPCWIASGKEEYSAFTFRSKLRKLLPYFLEPFPDVTGQKMNSFKHQNIDWDYLIDSLEFSIQVEPVSGFVPGSKAANKLLHVFFHERLSRYNSLRNDPNAKAVSDLAPYLHFGNISSQRIAIEVMKNFEEDENTKSFLEELIIRKELSDNFCYYNASYDNVSAFKNWAGESLLEHTKDEREFNYNFDDLKSGTTHDMLWNAAQMEMVLTGKMHGYMRMYWAKKILEWTKSPDIALNIAIRLNDTYSLDGRDPNGYTGCAWSIGGIHDRPWKERPIFGKIRYMNYNGCKRKFDVDRYIKRIGQIGS